MGESVGQAIARKRKEREQAIAQSESNKGNTASLYDVGSGRTIYLNPNISSTKIDGKSISDSQVKKLKYTEPNFQQSEQKLLTNKDVGTGSFGRTILQIQSGELKSDKGFFTVGNEVFASEQAAKYYQQQKQDEALYKQYGVTPVGSKATQQEIEKQKSKVQTDIITKRYKTLTPSTETILMPRTDILTRQTLIKPTEVYKQENQFTQLTPTEIKEYATKGSKTKFESFKSDAGSTSKYFYDATIGISDKRIFKPIGEIIGKPIESFGNLGKKGLSYNIPLPKIFMGSIPIPEKATRNVLSFSSGVIKEQGKAIQERPFTETVLFATTAEIGGATYSSLLKTGEGWGGFRVWTKAGGTKLIRGKSLTTAGDVAFTSGTIGLIGKEIVTAPTSSEKEYIVGETIKGGYFFGRGARYGSSFKDYLSKTSYGKETTPFQLPSRDSIFIPERINTITKPEQVIVDYTKIQQGKFKGYEPFLKQESSNPYHQTSKETQTFIKDNSPQIELISGTGEGYKPLSHYAAAKVKFESQFTKDIVTTDYEPTDTFLYKDRLNRLQLNKEKLIGTGQNQLYLKQTDLDFGIQIQKKQNIGYQRELLDYQMPDRKKPFWLSTGIVEGELTSEYFPTGEFGGYKFKSNFKNENLFETFKETVKTKSKSKVRISPLSLFNTKTSEDFKFNTESIPKSDFGLKFKTPQKVNTNLFIQPRLKTNQPQDLGLKYKFKQDQKQQQRQITIQVPRKEITMPKYIFFPKQPPEPVEIIKPEIIPPILPRFYWNIKQTKSTLIKDKGTKTKYNPSLIALSLGITSSNKGLSKKSYSGLEFRPILINKKRKRNKK